MTLLPPFYLDSLVPLELGPDDDGKFRAVATGFIVGIKVPQPDDSYATFLVTNKHVVADDPNFMGRFNRGNESVRVPVVATAPDGTPMWEKHPEYDLAITRINLDIIIEEGAPVAFIPEEQLWTAAQMRSEGVATGDDVFVLGFPLGLAGEQKTYGLARSGIIARFDEEIISSDQSYLIDSSVFPGNSGGPVALRPSVTSITGTPTIGQAMIIGVVSGYVPYTDRAISEQTQHVRITFEENSGLARVVPLEALRELADPAIAAAAGSLDVATKEETGQPEAPDEPLPTVEPSTSES
jgi:hypothetical protein